MAPPLFARRMSKSRHHQHDQQPQSQYSPMDFMRAFDEAEAVALASANNRDSEKMVGGGAEVGSETKHYSYEATVPGGGGGGSSNRSSSPWRWRRKSAAQAADTEKDTSKNAAIATTTNPWMMQQPAFLVDGRQDQNSTNNATERDDVDTGFCGGNSWLGDTRTDIYQQEEEEKQQPNNGSGNKTNDKEKKGHMRQSRRRGSGRRGRDTTDQRDTTSTTPANNSASLIPAYIPFYNSTKEEEPVVDSLPAVTPPKEDGAKTEGTGPEGGEAPLGGYDTYSWMWLNPSGFSPHHQPLDPSAQQNGDIQQTPSATHRSLHFWRCKKPIEVQQQAQADDFHSKMRSHSWCDGFYESQGYSSLVEPTATNEDGGQKASGKKWKKPNKTRSSPSSPEEAGEINHAQQQGNSSIPTIPFPLFPDQKLESGDKGQWGIAWTQASSEPTSEKRDVKTNKKTPTATRQTADEENSIIDVAGPRRSWLQRKRTAGQQQKSGDTVRRSKSVPRRLSSSEKNRSGKETPVHPLDSPDIVSQKTATGTSVTTIPTKGDKGQWKAVYNYFGPDPRESIHFEYYPQIPTPLAEDHVVVRVQASTVSVNDCMTRRGFCFEFVDPVCLPVTPGHDAVGTIARAGSKVSTFNVGDRVAALVRTGGNARYVSIPESSLVSVPKSIDAVDAACMVSIYTTAYQCLKSVSKHEGSMSSLEGLKILVVGGTDGVGQALVQMCNKARADVYVTAPLRRHNYIKNVVGAKPLPEAAEEWAPFVVGTMDVVFDGNCEDGLVSSKKALNQDGELVCFGLSSMLKETMGMFGAPMGAHLVKLSSRISSNVRILDIWESFKHDPQTFKRNLIALFQLLKWDKIKPHVAKRVDLSEVPAAHSKLEKGQVRGTVVCLPWKKPKALIETTEI